MTLRNKILILGAGGMLGNTLYRYFRDRTSHVVVGASRNAIVAANMHETENAHLIRGVDVENIDGLMQVLNKHRPDIVINCVGIIKQRQDADDSLTVLPINVMLPHRLSQLCGLLKARLIHFSTDCVFSGAKGMYSEEDMADAEDLYGRSKLLGEVKDSHAITIRTSLIGHELLGHKSLLNWFLAQEGQVRGYQRAIFSGFPVVEIGRIIDQYIIPNPAISGVHHVSAEPIDKFTLLNLVADIYGKTIEIKPDDKLAIDRSLDSSRFRKLTGYEPPVWKDLIAAMHAFQ